jgi:hypothetical protein
LPPIPSSIGGGTGETFALRHQVTDFTYQWRGIGVQATPHVAQNRNCLISLGELADGAVLLELLSAGKFPDQRENTGNFVDSKPNQPPPVPEKPHCRCAFFPNSLQIGTGNFDDRSGKSNSLIRF